MSADRGMAEADELAVRLRDVSFRYPGATANALSHVSWDIPAGTFTVVAGLSGSGKSTLLRTLNGLVPHYSGGRFGGSVSVRGVDTRRVSPRDLARMTGFVFQDPEAQMVTTRVDDEVAFGAEQAGMARTTMRLRVEEAMDLTGIAHLRYREISTLSGGERQRVAIAAALVSGPSLLVLDEPTSQLDPWTADDILAALHRLNADLGLSVVLAEHRLDRVLGLADRFMYALNHGEWLNGEPSSVIDDARIPDDVLPPVARLGRAEGWSPAPLTVKDARAAVVRHHFVPVAPQGIPRGAPSGSILWRGDDLSVVHGTREAPVVALRRVDLAVAEGEIIALMGRNGSGKTTLLRTICGLQRPAAGRMELMGTTFDPSRNGPSPSIGYLPQDPGSMLFAERVRDELSVSVDAARQRGSPGAPDPDRLLERLGLTGLADSHPADLSIGQRQRVALAAILAAGARILLLDEPTRGMDGPQKVALGRLLQELAADGAAVIMATHDVELAASVASRVVLLGNGETIVDAPVRDALSGAMAYAPQINRLFGHGFLTVEDVRPVR